MNCKQGDLAMYVGVHLPDCRGQITRCVEDATCVFDGLPSWRVVPPIGDFDYVLDASLRPIRDPGSDAVDEMVALHRRRKVEKASEPDPAFVGLTVYVGV